jgi:hypothetical protein
LGRKQAGNAETLHYKTIKVAPDLYRKLAHDAIDADRSLQEHTTIVLRRALGLERRHEPRALTANPQ